MRFKDRREAANLLVSELKPYEGTNPLVVGIPRGAMPMAKIIADGLLGELSAILVHKIPSRESEEFAIGSIGLSGHIQIMPYALNSSAEQDYIKVAAEKQLKNLKQRQTKYRLKDPDYKNRIVIIVDDGIATGATVLAAISEVKHHHPKKLIVAAAVASQDSAEKIRGEVDELVILSEPAYFYAVGQFFDNFEQVSDEEVIDILQNK